MHQNTTPYGLLLLAEQRAIQQAHSLIVYRGAVPEWEPVPRSAAAGGLKQTSVYRVVNTTPDSIAWSHVHEDFKFMARNANGLVHLFTARPGLAADGWFMGPANQPPAERAPARGHASYRRGTVGWAASLARRHPEVPVKTIVFGPPTTTDWPTAP
jgi:hypothetical protein